jgi:hypothetical protein
MTTTPTVTLRGTNTTPDPATLRPVLTPRWRIVVTASATTLVLLGTAHLAAVGLLWSTAQPGPLHDAGVHPETGSVTGVVTAGLSVVAGLAYISAGALLEARLRTWRTLALLAALTSTPVLLWAGPSAATGVVLDLGVLGVLVLGAALPVDRGTTTWADNTRPRLGGRSRPARRCAGRAG